MPLNSRAQCGYIRSGSPNAGAVLVEQFLRLVNIFSQDAVRTTTTDGQNVSLVELPEESQDLPGRQIHGLGKLELRDRPLSRLQHLLPECENE